MGLKEKAKNRTGLLSEFPNGCKTWSGLLLTTNDDFTACSPRLIPYGAEMFSYIQKLNLLASSTQISVGFDLTVIEEHFLCGAHHIPSLSLVACAPSTNLSSYAYNPPIVTSNLPSMSIKDFSSQKLTRRRLDFNHSIISTYRQLCSHEAYIVEMYDESNTDI